MKLCQTGQQRPDWNRIAVGWLLLRTCRSTCHKVTLHKMLCCRRIFRQEQRPWSSRGELTVCEKTHRRQGSEVCDNVLDLRSAADGDDDLFLFQINCQKVCRAMLCPCGG